ncbi:MAG: YqaA family protein [Bryobacteraceae bacterium]
MHTLVEFLSWMSQTLAAWGPWGIFLLAVIDSAGIPVSVGMDALLIVLGAKAPQAAWIGAGMAVAGSMIGNLILFLAARKGGSRFVKRKEAGSPGRFRHWFNRYGLVTVFIPAMVPIPLPLKVFVITAGMLRTRIASFFVVVLAARVIRYFGEAWLGVKLGQESVHFLKDHVWTLTGGAALMFAAIYMLLRFNDRRRKALDL